MSYAMVYDAPRVAKLNICEVKKQSKPDVKKACFSDIKNVRD